jgi:hypothetical protein
MLGESMNGANAATAGTEKRPEQSKKADQYYSAEFLVEGMEVLYQFKIWDVNSSSLSVLVNQHSQILPRIKVGDTLNVKYYSIDSGYASDYQKTAIRNITRNDEGRLKGHFLIGLEILET